MEAVQQHARTLDGPTVAAAVATLLFAVRPGVLLAYLPQDGQLGGAIEALKNVVYVLTVPFFDIVAAHLRAAARRASITQRWPKPRTCSPWPSSARWCCSCIVEAISWLTGFGMGGVCAVLRQSFTGIDFGKCLTIGIGMHERGHHRPDHALARARQRLDLAAAGPVGVLDDAALCSRWRSRSCSRSISSSCFQNTPDAVQTLKEHLNQVGPLRQIGLQVVILTHQHGASATGPGACGRRSLGAFA